MPPRRRPAPLKEVTQSTREDRVAKTQARNTIRMATNAHTRSHTSVTPSVQPEALALGSDSIDRLNNTLQDGFERMTIEIRQTNASIFSQLMERLEGIDGEPSLDRTVTTIVPPVVPTSVPGVSNSGTSSIPYIAPPSLNVLSRWSWVDQNIVEAIGNGQFDINHLPKFHREEDARNRHIKATTEDIFNPFDKSKSAEVFIDQIKLHQAFKEPASFFSAWNVYTSIRTSYYPEHGPGLSLFSERIYFHIQLNYPWYKILNYILAFFRAHQNSASEVWNDVDVILVANNLVVIQQWSALGTTISKSSIKGNTSISSMMIMDNPISQ